MLKSIRDSTKSKAKMGRPKTTGPGEPQIVRMHGEQLAAIDAWIATQEEKISRPEAIRRLVELGLLASANYPELRYQNKANESADKASKLARQFGLKVKGE